MTRAPGWPGSSTWGDLVAHLVQRPASLGRRTRHACLVPDRKESSNEPARRCRPPPQPVPPMESNVALGSVALEIIDMHNVDADRDRLAHQQYPPRGQDRRDFGLVEEVVTRTARPARAVPPPRRLVIDVHAWLEFPDGFDEAPIRCRRYQAAGMHLVRALRGQDLSAPRATGGGSTTSRRSVLCSTRRRTRPSCGTLASRTVIVVGVTMSSRVETTARNAARRGLPDRRRKDAVGGSTGLRITRRCARSRCKLRPELWTMEQVIVELPELVRAMRRPRAVTVAVERGKRRDEGWPRTTPPRPRSKW